MLKQSHNNPQKNQLRPCNGDTAAQLPDLLLICDPFPESLLQPPFKKHHHRVQDVGNHNADQDRLQNVPQRPDPRRQFPKPEKHKEHNNTNQDHQNGGCPDGQIGTDIPHAAFLPPCFFCIRLHFLCIWFHDKLLSSGAISGKCKPYPNPLLYGNRRGNKSNLQNFHIS